MYQNNASLKFSFTKLFFMLKRYFNKEKNTTKSNHPDLLKNIYYQWCDDERIKFDDSQLVIIAELQNTLDKIRRLLLYYQKPIWLRINTPPPKNPSPPKSRPNSGKPKSTC